MSPTADGASADLQQTVADLQRQLAEARAERDEFEAQKAALAEVLGIINSSPGDLTPVFDAMLEKATRLCGVPYGQLALFDGDNFRFVAVHGEHPFERHQPRDPRPPSWGVTWPRLVAGEDVVHTPDVAESEIYRSGHESARRFVEIGGGRSLLTVALRKDRQLVGALTVYSQQARPFSDKQIALLQNFAAQAVIAIENARLLSEQREALERQTATSEVLEVINASPGDLAPVFDAILEKAHSLCGIAQGSLELFDGERFRAVAVRGLSETLADLLRQGYPGSDNPATRPLIEGERFSYIADMAKSDYSVERTAAETGAARTLLCVPLRREGQLLGMIASARREVRPFSEKETALLENFAAQAVIAMDNARLLTETREALEQQIATAEILSVVNSSLGDLTTVFDAILEKAHRLCGVHRGSLQLFDGDRFRAVATRFPPDAEAFAERLRQGYPASDTAVLEPLRGGVRFVHVPDLAEVDDPVARAAIAAGTRSILYVPLRHDDVFLGMIVAAREEVRPFSENEIALLQNFAAQAVIAIENARLLGELRQRTDEVAELNRGLEARVAEQVEELGRVGRLKRFLAPQLAELIVSQGDEKILESHRREIVVVFCDLRGYTAFTETAEPEEVLDFLREYHGALGPLVSEFEGTLDQFSGDGIMVFFNDPVPIPDPAERAVKMAIAMREAASSLTAAWRERGRELGFGAGIAQGYATLGQIGFSERSGYTAIGTVCNVAARLCGEAKDGQILLSQRVYVALKGSVATEQVGALALKGLTQPVVTHNVPLTTSQPALRVIDGAIIERPVSEWSPVMAQLRSASQVRTRPIPGVDRTYDGHHESDATDPQRTWLPDKPMAEATRYRSVG